MAASPRRSDYVSMTGFNGWMKETDTVWIGDFKVIIGRSPAGIASALNLFAPDGVQIVRGYRTGMGKFTLFDWRSGFKHHHSFTLWMSVFSYLEGQIAVWEDRQNAP